MHKPQSSMALFAGVVAAFATCTAFAQEAQQAYLAGFGPLLTQTIFARCTHYGTTDSPSHL